MVNAQNNIYDFFIIVIFIIFAPDKNMNVVCLFVFRASFINNINRNPGTVATCSHIARIADKVYITCSDSINLLMMRIFKIVVFGVFINWITVSARAEIKGKENFDWNPVMDAIIQVESNGDPMAKSGSCIGVMQISPICVKECNDILKKRGSKKRYTMADRYDVGKSREMFVVIQSYHNPSNNVEKAIRSWNGGQNYSVKGTQKYYNKVMRHMK